MHYTKEIFETLRDSHWAFSRVITNIGQAKGYAKINSTKNNNSILHYKEQGQITLHNKEGIKFHREYIYKYDENTSSISIYFCENKQEKEFFHTLSIDKSYKNNQIKAHAKHLCINDMYEVTYNFLSKNKWLLQYRVIGPKKNYLIKTTFTRDIT